MQEAKLDDEGNLWIDGKQETSSISEVVSEKVDSNLATSNTDTQTGNMLKGELCGLYTQVSIGYVDIFEVLREEILAAEARELEVDGLLSAREGFEESSNVEADESTDVREPTVAATEGPDHKGDAINCSFHGNTTDAGNEALVQGSVQKGEEGQTEAPCSRSGGLLEDTTSREGEGMGAENFQAVHSQDNEAGPEDQLNSAEPPSEGTSGEAQQNGNNLNREETPSPLIRDLTGDTLPKKDKGAATDLGHDTPLDKLTGDDGGHRLPADISDQPLEHSDAEEYSRSTFSDDDECSRSTFSGPVAFSGMLSYSGLIPYSGQIPHSGHMSLHSDSSTSTRSFAFPILASDWNSSPAKIGQPDSRYFRRRRRWRPSCCCRRPTTLCD